MWRHTCQGWLFIRACGQKICLHQLEYVWYFDCLPRAGSVTSFTPCIEYNSNILFQGEQLGHWCSNTLCWLHCSCMTTQLNAGQRLCVWLFDPNQTGDGMSIHSMHIPKRLSHIHYNRHSHPQCNLFIELWYGALSTAAILSCLKQMPEAPMGMCQSVSSLHLLLSLYLLTPSLPLSL